MNVLRLVQALPLVGLVITSVHQAVIREGMSEEAVKYTTRRFTFFITHVNMIFSIGISSIIVIFTHLLSTEYSIIPEQNVVACVFKIAVVLIYVGYVIAAIFSLAELKKRVTSLK